MKFSKRPLVVLISALVSVTAGSAFASGFGDCYAIAKTQFSWPTDAIKACGRVDQD